MAGEGHNGQDVTHTQFYSIG